MTTLIISQDADSCIFTNPPQTCFSKITYDTEPNIVEKSNSRYVKVLAKLASSLKVKRIIFVNGSAAQTGSMIRNIARMNGTMGVIEGIKVIIKMLQEQIPHIPIEFSTVTMSDVAFSQPPEQGLAFSTGKMEGPAYHSKLAIVYLAAHYLVRKIREQDPGERIRFVHVDDRDDINQDLVKYLAPLLPRDMVFNALTYPQFKCENHADDNLFYSVTQEGFCTSSMTARTDPNPFYTLTALFKLFPPNQPHVIKNHFAVLLDLFTRIQQRSQEIYADGLACPRYSSLIRCNHGLFSRLLPHQDEVKNYLDRLDGLPVIQMR